VKDSNCWVLHPGEKWHGFGNLFEDGYCMLDPIKVSVVTPGVATDGSFEKPCIPAKLVTAYLDHRGIVVEKTNDFTILFLFSIGITKGKWVTLVNALLKFKDDYDNNAPLDEVLPELVKTHPDFYGTNGIQGLHDLADRMFEQMKKGQLELQKKAFSSLPSAAMTPNEAYQKLVHNEVEPVKVEDMADRIVATGVVPYPPCIPMLMPGENAGAENGPYLSYLSALLYWNDKFPGFSHEIHGVEKNKKGEYQVYCLKQNDKGQQ
jgi:arginine/lysine/ornithine decarboxylase